MNETQARTEAVGDQLRAKINSKFQTSTFLAGFALAMLSIQISTMWQSERVPRLLPVSIAVMIASFVLYIAAVVRLDALTMPKCFWPEVKGRKRDPLGLLKPTDLPELKKQMVFHWSTLTLVATLLAMIALLLMLTNVTFISLKEHDQEKTETIQSIIGDTTTYTAIGVILALIYVFGLSFVARNWYFDPLVDVGDD